MTPTRGRDALLAIGRRRSPPLPFPFEDDDVNDDEVSLDETTEEDHALVVSARHCCLALLFVPALL